MTDLTIKLYGIYTNKRNETVMIVGTVGPEARWDYECGMRFVDHVSRTYRPDGTYNNIPGENTLDLCQEITNSEEKINFAKNRINDIYDVDLDYEMSFYDLSPRKQKQYNDLKEMIKDLESLPETGSVSEKETDHQSLRHDDKGMYLIRQTGEMSWDVYQHSTGIVVASAARRDTAGKAANALNACAIVPNLKEQIRR